MKTYNANVFFPGSLGPVNREVILADDYSGRLKQAEELLLSISNWLVCECITTPEDMAQSFTPFREQIEVFLND